MGLADGDYLRFPAKLVRVVDGDTYDLELDLGFNLQAIKRFRLRGVNCPEPRGVEEEAGILCSDYVEFMFSEMDDIVVRTYKSDSFGRWLCDIEIKNNELLSEYLCEYGYALPWDGRGVRPGFDPSGPYPIPVDPAEVVDGERSQRERVGVADPRGA
tara:strand:+ start:2964 stop:3434 length:471 start_codon:yes stop_codon:yes gene_type:complete